jgi:hypothetical protein
MTGTLRYRTSAEHTDTPDYAEGIVWSPGPAAQTVWVLPYSGASQSEAVCVHAPTPKRPFWYRESAPWGTAETFSRVTWRHEARPVTMAETLAHITAPRYSVKAGEAQMYRQAMAHAPQLPRKTWYAALGVDNVAQLALDAEDVAA